MASPSKLLSICTGNSKQTQMPVASGLQASVDHPSVSASTLKEGPQTGRCIPYNAPEQAAATLPSLRLRCRLSFHTLPMGNRLPMKPPGEPPKGALFPLPCLTLSSTSQRRCSDFSSYQNLSLQLHPLLASTDLWMHTSFRASLWRRPLKGWPRPCRSQCPSRS